MEGKQKVLVVDDEQDILDLLRYHLEREGLEVSTANNGKAAVQVAKSERPDLVVLDVMMPGMDGVEVCQVLRRTPGMERTLIAFLTARTEDYSQIAGFEAGADDYIPKPVRPKVFVTKIKALLKRSRQASEPLRQLEANGIRIDLDRINVNNGTEDLQLPKKEFELLALLMSKPGKVFRREEIYSHIWGDDLFVGDRTIDVHIRKLREKIGEDRIGTVKGIGYRFEV